MPFVAIVIGAIIIIAAFNNTHGDLATNLEKDIPEFFTWGAAIAAILGIGLIPGMAKPSRMVFALVVLVLVLANYQRIIDGFKEFALSSGEPSAPAPAATAPATSGGSSGNPLASILTPSTFLDLLALA